MSLLDKHKLTKRNSVWYGNLYPAYTVLYGLVSVISIYCIFVNYISRCAGLLNLSNFYIYSAMPLLILVSAFVAYATQTQNKPERYYLLVSIPALTGLSMFLLPGHVPDEGAHIAQVAGLFVRSADGFPIPEALSEANLPSNYEQFYWSFVAAPSWSNQVFYERYLGSYLGHLYLIPAVVLRIGEAVGANELQSLIWARTAHGVLFSAIGFALIRLIPFGKTAFFVFLVNPMLLQQASSCSADAISNLAILSFIVIVLRANVKSVLTARDVITLVACSVLMVISKFAYAPFLLLLLLFVKRISTKRGRLVAYMTSAGVLICITLYFLLFYNGSFMPMAFDLLRKPIEFIKVYLKSVWELGPFWIQSYAGGSLGALSIGVWQPCYWAYIVIQICVLFYNDDKDSISIRLTNSDRFIMCFTALLDFTCILLSMREWSVTVDKRSDIIMGVQGRYLFPIMLMPLFSMLRFNINKSNPCHVLQTVTMILVCILSLDMLVIICFFN